MLTTILKGGEETQSMKTTAITCCLYISDVAEKLHRSAMFIKFRSMKICETTLDPPSPPPLATPTSAKQDNKN